MLKRRLHIHSITWLHNIIKRRWSLEHGKLFRDKRPKKPQTGSTLASLARVMSAHNGGIRLQGRPGIPVFLTPKGVYLFICLDRSAAAAGGSFRRRRKGRRGQMVGQRWSDVGGCERAGVAGRLTGRSCNNSLQAVSRNSVVQGGAAATTVRISMFSSRSGNVQLRRQVFCGQAVAECRSH